MYTWGHSKSTFAYKFFDDINYKNEQEPTGGGGGGHKSENLSERTF